MHSDTKIGLAMAILLIGFAGALCFPRYQADDLSLDLTDAAELDNAIKLLPIRAYTADEQGLPTESESVEPPFTPPEEPAFSPADIVSASRLDHPQLIQTPAAPIQSSMNPLANDQLGLPDSQQTEHPIVEGQAAARGSCYHTVAPGDTLSEIAEQYLGSVARYEEIFEANRDVLSTPDDLKLGTKLRIPAATNVEVSSRRVEGVER